ncbi:hypothetical protein BJX99DRAFT_243951 [Aspergillus californicus]
MAFPAGVRPPLSTDNDDDHSGLIVVITSFFLVLTLASLAARAFFLYRKRIVQVDDYMFGVLVITAFLQASVVMAQVHYKWGTREGLSQPDTDRMLKAGYTADILSIIVLGLSKIATCLFYEALFYQMQRRFIRVVLGATIIWTVVSILLVSIRCSSQPWHDFSDECGGLFPRWQAIIALDVVTEALLVFFAAFAIYQVKIDFRKKLMVFSALGCRVVLIPLTALRLHYTKTQLTSPTPALTGAYATTVTEIYLSLTLVCQITSSLKFIVAVYEDKHGVSYTDGSTRSTQKSKNPTSTDIYSHKPRSFSLGLGDRVKLVDSENLRLERGRGSIGETAGSSGDASGGLHIFRSVQINLGAFLIQINCGPKPSEV